MKKYTTCSVCTRLNVDQIKRLDIMAAEKRLNRSLFVREIILDYLDKDLEKENIIESNLERIEQKIDKKNSKDEFFMQYFHAWILTWFASHPQITQKDSSTFVKATTERRNHFDNLFVSKIYNVSGELYDSLFANHVENETDDKKDNQ